MTLGPDRRFVGNCEQSKDDRRTGTKRLLRFRNSLIHMRPPNRVAEPIAPRCGRMLVRSYDKLPKGFRARNVNLLSLMRSDTQKIRRDFSRPNLGREKRVGVRAEEPVRSEIPIDLLFGPVNAVIAGADAIRQMLCQFRIDLSQLVEGEPDPLGNRRTGPLTV